MDRHAQVLASMQRTQRRQASRIASLDGGWPVAALPAVIATVTGTPPSVTVYLNGATAASGPYQCLASYTPAVGDSVLALPVGAQQSYTIIGKVG